MRLTEEQRNEWRAEACWARDGMVEVRVEWLRELARNVRDIPFKGLGRVTERERIMLMLLQPVVEYDHNEL